jgi:hypothetical protein
MQAVVQNPWDIVPVNNPENESVLSGEILGHGCDSEIFVAVPYAKHLGWHIERKKNKAKPVIGSGPLLPTNPSLFAAYLSVVVSTPDIFGPSP